MRLCFADQSMILRQRSHSAARWISDVCLYSQKRGEMEWAQKSGCLQRVSLIFLEIDVTAG